MSGDKPANVIGGTAQYVLEKPGKAFTESADRRAIPKKQNAIVHCFRTQDIRTRPARQGRSADYVSWRHPYRDEFLSVKGLVKETCSTLPQEEEVVGLIACLRYCGFSCDSVRARGLQDRVNVFWGHAPKQIGRRRVRSAKF